MCEHCGRRYLSADDARAVYPLGGDVRPLMHEPGLVRLAYQQESLADWVPVAAAYHLHDAHPDEFAVLFPHPVVVDVWPRTGKRRAA